MSEPIDINQNTVRDEKSKIKSFAKTTAKGTVWTYIGQFGSKFAILLSTIILARLLTTEEYGIVGYATVVLSYLNVIHEFGVGPSLIYYEENEERSNTGFYLSVLTGIVLFGIMWVSAPWIAAFFDEPRSIPVTRALGLVFPIEALGSVHSALLRKRLAFKLTAIPQIIKSIFKALSSVTLALLGFSVWSLVLGQLLGAITMIICLWFLVPWRPKLSFDISQIKPLMTFGIGMIALDAVAIFLNNGDYLFVGYYFDTETLGVYTLAFRLPNLLVISFCTTIGKVLFPVYARMRDDENSLRTAFLMTMRYVTIITIPMGLGLALVAEPFVLTVFTDKWIDMIPVMRAISIYTVFLSVSYNIGSVYKAQGRLKILTYLGIARGVVLFPMLWYASARIGEISAVGWSHASAALIAAILNLAIASRTTDTPISAIILNLRSGVVSGLIMLVGTYAVMTQISNLQPLPQLVITTTAGVIIYGLAISFLEREIVEQAITFGKRKFQSIFRSKAKPKR